MGQQSTTTLPFPKSLKPLKTTTNPFPTTRSFPEEVLEHVLSFIDSNLDLNSVSLVCKTWYEVDRWCRRNLFIGNCYAVAPINVIQRFKDVRSVTIKGKPHFADFNLVPDNWGAHSFPWIFHFSQKFVGLEEIKFKRMVVSDEGLELIGRNLRNFRVLILCSCDGFSTNGLASIAANCSHDNFQNIHDEDLMEFADSRLMRKRS